MHASFPPSFGIHTHRGLLESGLTRHRIRRLVSEGALRRIRVGWYATRRPHPDVLAAVAAGGALSGAHRLQLMGGWLPHGCVRQVWFPGPVPRHHAGIVPRLRPRLVQREVAHGVVPWQVALSHHLRSGCPLVDRVTVVGSLRMPIPERMRDDSPVPESFRPDLPVLRAVVAAHPDGERIWKLSGLACDNGFELHVATLLVLDGLRVEVQVRIDGGRWRIDIVVEGRVAIELDGQEHYTQEQHDRDTRKGAAVARAHLRLLRFSYQQVMEHWPDVSRAIHAELGIA